MTLQAERSTNRTRYRALPAAIAMTACLLAAGCSSSTTTKPALSTPPAAASTSAPASATGSPMPASSGSAQPAAAVRVTIKDFAYQVSGAAAPGSTVQVTNNDSEAHTLTADSNTAFDITIQPGKTEHFTAPTKPGSYPFHCNFHSDMHATLTVKS